MNVSKYKILRSSLDKQIDIPIEIKWDIYGQEDELEKFQEDVVEQAIGKPKDFELARFQNKIYNNSFDTSVNYQFYFYTGLTNEINNSVQSDWGITYLSQGFTNEEIYYTTKPFLKSFFKLDFYDTTSTNTQRIFFSIILPANQSKDAQFSISPYLPLVNVSIPIYNLDYVNQKEGYFLYWLKSREFFNIDTFYMRAKFFNGSTGQFITLMNRSQASPQLVSTKYSFDSSKYLYYKVVMDYNDYTYQIFDTVGPTQVRVGSLTNPIKFYEYINPA
jgi:hypothetical protein